MTHFLSGYDRVSEGAMFSCNILPRYMNSVKTYVTHDADDPDLIGCYELDRVAAEAIAALMGINIPEGLDYFLEAAHP